jgi:hypothetical protein
MTAATPATPAAPASGSAIGTVSRVRRTSFVVLAALLAVFTGLVMGGLPALLGTFETSAEQVIHRVHALHWHALMGVLLAVPLAWLAVRRTVAPAQQVAIVIASFLVAAAAAQMLDPALAVFLVLTGLLLFLHPRRGELFQRGEGFSATLGALAAAVSVPSLWYAWSEVQTHLAAPLSDPHRGPPEAHYVSGAALAIAIPAVAWLVSQRTAGWRLPAWCAGLAMAMTGAVSIWLPGWVSSFGRLWGLAALVWGLAFIAAAELVSRRRGRSPSPRRPSPRGTRSPRARP